MQARTTAICAVWHADPDRFELLAGHSANLDQQICPVKRIYVFDNGDDPQINFTGRAINSQDRLTVYQAWNLALSKLDTPFVVNLNLDDRLAPDAIALMEDALDAGGDLVGGDWKMCYNQRDTDVIAPCYPADTIPYVSAWPPDEGSITRLGSGTAGSRRTFGPACMWRAALHQQIGKYPDQFGDGTLIRVIGDSIWWRVLQKHQKNMIRLPTIIGNYHSHPQTQAEFRHSALDEEQALQNVGVLLT
jgi:hypothetical protein